MFPCFSFPDFNSCDFNGLTLNKDNKGQRIMQLKYLAPPVENKESASVIQGRGNSGGGILNRLKRNSHHDPDSVPEGKGSNDRFFSMTSVLFTLPAAL